MKSNRKYFVITFLFAFLIIANLQGQISSLNIPKKKNLWVFLMAGQSNMAGRGLVEAEDTITNPRIFTINEHGDIILAKEPLHFYEPNLVGLDCGLSFAKSMLKHMPRKASILILPTAVGGSSVQQWIGDSTFRKVSLLTNFKEKVKIGMKYGNVKGIIWHQGESNTNNMESIEMHFSRLGNLFSIFRGIINNPKLPIILGELGSFSKNNENWQMLNRKFVMYVQSDSYSALIKTQDLIHKGDFIHFNSAGQREMGLRYAEEMIKILK